MTGQEERVQETELKFTSLNNITDKRTVITEKEIKTATRESMKDNQEIQIIK